MSSDGQDQLPLIEQAITSQYCIVAALAFILYDTALCFDLEVKYVWRRKPNVATLLYVASRYGCILSAVFGIASIWSTTVFSCIVTNHIYVITSVVTEIATVGLGAFRVWAIWTRRWVFFLLVLVTGLVLPSLRVYYATAQSEDGLYTAARDVSQCNWVLTVAPELYSRLATMGRAFAIVSDALVLTLTWAKTYSIKREAERTGIKARLSTLLIRDGTIYFLSLFIMNLAIIVLDQTAGADIDNITWFSDALSAVAISHLVLNLRTFQFSSRDRDQDPFSLYGHGGVRSAYLTSCFDDMGAPVVYGSEADESVVIVMEDPTENPLAVGLDVQEEDGDEEG